MVISLSDFDLGTYYLVEEERTLKIGAWWGRDSELLSVRSILGESKMLERTHEQALPKNTKIFA